MISIIIYLFLSRNMRYWKFSIVRPIRIYIWIFEKRTKEHEAPNIRMGRFFSSSKIIIHQANPRDETHKRICQSGPPMMTTTKEKLATLTTFVLNAKCSIQVRCECKIIDVLSLILKCNNLVPYLRARAHDRNEFISILFSSILRSFSFREICRKKSLPPWWATILLCPMSGLCMWLRLRGICLKLEAICTNE